MRKQENPEKTLSWPISATKDSKPLFILQFFHLDNITFPFQAKASENVRAVMGTALSHSFMFTIDK